MKKKKESIIISSDAINGKSNLIAEIPKSGKLQSLTDAQIKHMESVKKFWTDYIFLCKNQVNREAANIGIEWLYKLTGRDRPIIIYTESPMACQYAVAYLKETLKLIPALNKGAQVRAQVGDQVRDQVWAQVRDQVGAQVRDQVGAQVWAQGIEFNSFATYGSIADYGWVSFYDFFQQIGVHNHEGFQQFKNILLSGIYDMIQLNGFCIVSNMPDKIIRNDTNRLHNAAGPAIQFRDGYKQYFINGRAIPFEVYDKAATLTKKEFISEKNSDYKGAWYEILGQKKMMDLLGAIEVDQKTIAHKNGDLETVTLLKTKEKFAEIENQPFAWVKMICPSTGTQYLQGVEPHHTCAIEAIASLSPFRKEEYSFNYRS